MSELPKLDEIKARLPSTAFAFRGYNTTNLGRTAELLAHHAFGAIVEKHLRVASQVCSDITACRVDLVERVKAGRESTLDSFAEDIALVISVELAQLELLATFFDVDYQQSRLGFGFSLGEVTALAAGGVFEMSAALPPLLAMAGDCADLARDVTMGVVFSRGPALDFAAVERLCLKITAEGQGVIAISSYLSPNTVLVLGQGKSVDRFKQRMPGFLGDQVHLRKNSERWPPLHTPVLWQRNVPNRAAVQMQTMPGGFVAPSPPVLSMVTGKASYNDYNCRSILTTWIDHPQRLWDAVYELLASGTEVVIHVGPDPNLLPATFKRLSDNVSAQLTVRSFNTLGMRAMSGMVNRPWLTKLLAARAALLRAPFVVHVVLEDWILAQEVG